jgi:hypothetical protein
MVPTWAERVMLITTSQLDGILAVTPIFRHTASTCGCVSS